MNANVTVTCTGNGGGSAVLLVNADNGSPNNPITGTVYNPGAPVWLGGPSVTPTNGVPLATGATKDFSLSTGNNLYAIGNTATTTVALYKENS